MSMPRLIRHRDAIRLIAAIVLIGWLVRVLVPAGFMPSAGGVHGGLPGLVICSQGMPNGFLPLSGPSPPDAVAAAHCLAGSLFSYAAMPGPLGLVLLASVLWFVARSYRRRQSGHVSWLPGLPVGSRAPPSWSAFSLLQPA